MFLMRNLSVRYLIGILFVSSRARRFFFLVWKSLLLASEITTVAMVIHFQNNDIVALPDCLIVWLDNR